ncbi:discoidin domain-containing protein [Spirosoma sp. KUDC1026]|uniref:discoidin domain-containing protein n=1 Tax=Spirosoma sp. KUDC1026 TaxID=2745947 RepID=UPI00159BD218|nr:discoidin domain-containing protein [Spirosoma sp. KUDC1026]QKZ15185.1 discoidin domain-containing protein [Spirosoma sp. KUDC1026]
MRTLRLLIFLLLPALCFAQPPGGYQIPPGGIPYRQNQVQYLGDSLQINRQRVDAIRNALGVTNTNLNQGLSGLSQSILQRPTFTDVYTRQQAIDAFKPKTYQPIIQIGTVTTAPSGTPASLSVVQNGDVTTINATLPKGDQGAPGGSQQNAVTSVNNTTAVGGNVNLNADKVPAGVTNIYAVPGEYGRSIKRTSADLTGTVNEAATLQNLINQGGGKVVLTGKLYINNQVLIRGINNLVIEGQQDTIIVGPNLGEVFFVDSCQNVSITGITFIRAAGNTNTPISIHVRNSRNINASYNNCYGVLGPQTFRLTYSQATINNICYNVTFNNNTIKGTDAGVYGGFATLLQFVDGGSASYNTVDDVVNGPGWWGGDGNYLNGQNNSTNTATKWARNLTFIGNTVSRTNRLADHGGSVWGSMGENVTVASNTGFLSNDVLFDDEAGSNNTFANNTGGGAKNAALAVFYGSENTQFLNNTIRQGPNDGNGLHVYGNLVARNLTLSGGSITTLNPTVEAVFNEDGLLDGFTWGNGLSIYATYRAVKLQKPNNVKVSGVLSITSAVQNVTGAGANSAVYVQGGTNIDLRGMTLTYSGTATSGVRAVYLGDGGSGNLIGANVESIMAPSFPGGIYNDQFNGGSGNRFANNNVVDIFNNAGNIIRRGNYKPDGTILDGLDLTVAKMFQPDRQGSGAKYITTPNNDWPSGWYTVNSTSMPSGSVADNWYMLRNHHQNSAGTDAGGYWWDLAYKFGGNGQVYTREVNAGTPGPWYLLGSGTGGGSATTDASQLTSGTLSDARLSTNVMQKNTYDPAGNGIVDNAEALGGNGPGFYAKQSDVVSLSAANTGDQTLSLSGSTLSISRGNSVTLSTAPTGGAGGFLSGTYPNPGVNSTALNTAIDAYLSALPGRVAGSNQLIGRDSTNALRYFSFAGVASTAPANTTADYSTTGTVISDGGGSFNNDPNSFPAVVFDKNINTFYNAANGDANKYVGRDLGGAYSVNTARILARQSTGGFGERTRINGAQVQYSADGSNWTTVPNGTISGVTESNYTQYITISFTAITARYWRLFWSASGSYGNAAEFEIRKNDLSMYLLLLLNLLLGGLLKLRRARGAIVVLLLLPALCRAQVPTVADQNYLQQSIAAKIDVVGTIADLKAKPLTNQNIVVLVQGKTTATDGQGAFYRWMPLSTDAEDMTFLNVVISSLATTGRWVRLNVRNLQLPHGVLAMSGGLKTFYASGLTNVSSEFVVNLTYEGTATGTPIFSQILENTTVATPTTYASTNDIVTGAPISETAKTTTYHYIKGNNIILSALGTIGANTFINAPTGTKVRATITGI